MHSILLATTQSSWRTCRFSPSGFQHVLRVLGSRKSHRCGLEMPLALGPLFEGLPVPSADRLLYSVANIPGYPAYFIGKDNNAHACLLIAAPDKESRRHVPIRLESLEVTFDTPSVVRRAARIFGRCVHGCALPHGRCRDRALFLVCLRDVAANSRPQPQPSCNQRRDHQARSHFPAHAESANAVC